MCLWWKCADCGQEFHNVQFYSDNEHCPECRSIKVYCMEDEEVSKFTPRPWEVVRNPSWLVKVDVKSKDGSIAFVSSLSEEDARLISAAPDMYEALEEVLMQIGAVAELMPDKIIDTHSWCDLGVAVESARESLAKARGEKC